jgi:hypothetical protein
MMNQSLKKFAHFFPTLFSGPIKYSRKEERHFVEYLIFSTDQTVDFMVHELEINFHEFIRHLIGLVVGQKFRYDLKGRYFDDLVSIFGKCE